MTLMMFLCQYLMTTWMMKMIISKGRKKSMEMTHQWTVIMQLVKKLLQQEQIDMVQAHLAQPVAAVQNDRQHQHAATSSK